MESKKSSEAIYRAGIFFGCWAIIFLLSLLVRLPQFLSVNFSFDGDEAIVGIMAQDLLEGRHFPIYFYGQQYGFSTFEVFSVAFFIKLFGTGIWALRLGGLLIFSFGVTFLYKSARLNSLSVLWSWLVVLAVVCFPSWYIWGSLVRGGYLTAFAAGCLLFYILQWRHLNVWKWIFAGLLIALIYESHALILIVLFPFVVYRMWNEKQWLKNSLLLLIVAIGLIFAIRFLGTQSAVWDKPNLQFGLSLQWENLLLQFRDFKAGFSNFFYYEITFGLPLWWNILVCIALLVMMGMIVRDFYLSDRHRKFLIVGFVICLFVYLFVYSTVSKPAPRYWIGFFTGILFLLVNIILLRHKERFFQKAWLSLAVIFIAGAGVGSKMKTDWCCEGVNDAKALNALYQKVKTGHFKAVFITDVMIQWKWNYLYGNEIPATAFSYKERTNRFCNKVGHIYATDSKTVAIVGMNGIFYEMDFLPGFNDTRYVVGEKYFINPNADSVFVAKGFDFVR